MDGSSVPPTAARWQGIPARRQEVWANRQDVWANRQDGWGNRQEARASRQEAFWTLVDHQAVSRLMRWLDQQLLGWRQQPIVPVYKVVYIDGMYVSVRGLGKRTVMIAAGRRDDGGLDVLGFCVSAGESCRALLADLRRRGLEDVQLFVRDESNAIRSALENVYPEVPWQHCCFHRLAALRAQIGPPTLPRRHGPTSGLRLPLPVATGRPGASPRLGPPLATPGPLAGPAVHDRPDQQPDVLRLA